jgi:N-acetylmuramoyl-L-alanine amidase
MDTPLVSRVAHAPSLAAFVILAAAGCASTPPDTEASAAAPGYVIAAGVRVPVDVPVITFPDAGGFDAGIRHRWFDPGAILPSSPAAGCETPTRAGPRRGEAGASTTLEHLQGRLRQFVVHYDVAVTSRNCFKVLHDVRGLSVHFLLDVDGTLYQTLDLTARARHAGSANDASIGVEIAHPGAYPTQAGADRFYTDDGARLVSVASMEPPPGGPFSPARPGLFEGTLNGSRVVQRDFTEAQYRTLERLVGALARAFPGLAGGPPRAEDGSVARDALESSVADSHRGLIGHVHVSRGKVDPGPAFDWERMQRALDSR